MRIIIVSNERRERSNVAHKNWTCLYFLLKKNDERKCENVYFFFIKIKTL